MFCSGRVYCDFVSLGRDSMSISRVRRDDDLIKFLMPHLRAFWEHAQTDDEFELDLDMRDRVDIREEVNASLAESMGLARLVRFPISTSGAPTGQRGEVTSMDRLPEIGRSIAVGEY